MKNNVSMISKMKKVCAVGMLTVAFGLGSCMAIVPATAHADTASDLIVKRQMLISVYQQLIAQLTQMIAGMVAENDAVTAAATSTPTVSTVEYLVVAGGGGGGSQRGGGGGGGGVLTGVLTVAAQSYVVTVGSGGAAATGNDNPGGIGGNSSFNSITAHGGGGGGNFTNKNGVTGGSGGGGEGAGAGFGIGGTGNAGEGYAGGNGTTVAPYGSGGGGGAGAAGANATGLAGAGGNGVSNAITGTALYYGGGGGGTDNNGVGALGGNGGGGRGADNGAGVSGTANTGGGGGGGLNDIDGPPGAGGSGIVIVRYHTDGSDGVSPSSIGGTKTTSGAYTIHTFTSSGTFTPVIATSTTPAPSTLGNGLVSYWNMDGNSNSTVGNQNGSDSGVSYSTGNGRLNQGLGLSGSASKVDFSGPVLTGTGDISVSLWVKTAQTTKGVLMAQRDTASVDGQWFVQINSDNINTGKITFSDYDLSHGTAGINVKTTTAINDNNWHHVVCTRTGNVGRIYVDGSLNVTSSDPGFKASYGRLFSFGYDRRDSSTYYNGALDEVGTWSRALTADEVTQLYNAGAGRSYSSF